MMKSILKDNERSIRLYCDCMDLDHMLQFSYFDDPDYPEKFLYFTSALNANVPFWHRLKLAVRYVFRLGHYKTSMFGETVLLPSDARDLTSFLQKFNDYIERNNMFE